MTPTFSTTPSCAENSAVAPSAGLRAPPAATYRPIHCPTRPSGRSVLGEKSTSVTTAGCAAASATEARRRKAAWETRDMAARVAKSGGGGTSLPILSEVF